MAHHPRHVSQAIAAPMLAQIEADLLGAHIDAFHATRDIREKQPGILAGALAFVRHDLIVHFLRGRLAERELELGVSWKNTQGLVYLDMNGPRGKLALRFNKLGDDYMPSSNDTEQSIVALGQGWLFPDAESATPEPLLTVGGIYDAAWESEPRVWAVSIINNTVDWKQALTGSALRSLIPVHVVNAGPVAVRSTKAKTAEKDQA